MDLLEQFSKSIEKYLGLKQCELISMSTLPPISARRVFSFLLFLVILSNPRPLSFHLPPPIFYIIRVKEHMHPPVATFYLKINNHLNS